jgi:CBS domain-containing protein
MDQHTEWMQLEIDRFEMRCLGAGDGCLPVVDESGGLIGIVTERDYLRFAVTAIEMHD